MCHKLRQTAARVLPQPVRTQLRETINPLTQAWIQSPLAKYLDHQRADVYLISFPRSGRTWLRTMIGTAICQHFDLDRPAPEMIADLWQYNTSIPVIRLDHGAVRLENPDKFKQKKVILLVRNPLDIGVSRYHYKQRPDTMENHVSHTVKQVVHC